jgi:hypothetical protein
MGVLKSHGSVRLAETTDEAGKILPRGYDERGSDAVIVPAAAPVGGDGKSVGRWFDAAVATVEVRLDSTLAAAPASCTGAPACPADQPAKQRERQHRGSGGTHQPGAPRQRQRTHCDRGDGSTVVVVVTSSPHPGRPSCGSLWQTGRRVGRRKRQATGAVTHRVGVESDGAPFGGWWRDSLLSRGV